MPLRDRQLVARSPTYFRWPCQKMWFVETIVTGVFVTVILSSLGSLKVQVSIKLSKLIFDSNEIAAMFEECVAGTLRLIQKQLIVVEREGHSVSVSTRT
jgi:hypothetical protein